MNFDRLEQARFRLGNCVVNIDDSPYYVEAVDYTEDFAESVLKENESLENYYEKDVGPKNLRVRVRPLPVYSGDGLGVSESFALSDVKISPPLLGFGLNKPKGGKLFSAPPVYYERRTARVNRVGLSSQNTARSIIGPVNGNNNLIDRRGDVFTNSCLRSAILGDLPSLSEAYEMLDGVSWDNLEKFKVIPFHRRYAVGLDPLDNVTLYRGVDLVALSKDGLNFNMLPRFSYLVEDIQEATDGAITCH